MVEGKDSAWNSGLTTFEAQMGLDRAIKKKQQNKTGEDMAHQVPLGKSEETNTGKQNHSPGG